MEVREKKLLHEIMISVGLTQSTADCMDIFQAVLMVYKIVCLKTQNAGIESDIEIVR